MLLPRDMYIYLTHRHADRQIEGRGREREGRRLWRAELDKMDVLCGALSHSLSLSLSLSATHLTSVPSRLGFACGCSTIVVSIL